MKLDLKIVIYVFLAVLTNELSSDKEICSINQNNLHLIAFIVSKLFSLLGITEFYFSLLDEIVDTLGEGAFGKVVECIDHKA